MAIQRTGHVAIRVRDLEAAKRFYGDILGMKLGMEIPGQGLFFRFNDYHHDLAVFKARDGAEAEEQARQQLLGRRIEIDPGGFILERHRQPRRTDACGKIADRRAIFLLAAEQLVGSESSTPAATSGSEMMASPLAVMAMAELVTLIA